MQIIAELRCVACSVPDCSGQTWVSIACGLKEGSILLLLAMGYRRGCRAQASTHQRIGATTAPLMRCVASTRPRVRELPSPSAHPTAAMVPFVPIPAHVRLLCAKGRAGTLSWVYLRVSA